MPFSDFDVQDNDTDTHQMSFWDHLEEFRWVLLKSLLTLTITTLIGFQAVNYLYPLIKELLSKVRDSVELIYNAPLEAMAVWFKLSLLTGIILATPFILYFLWTFIAPALQIREKKLSLWAIGGGTVFFCLGVMLGYVVLSFALGFLVKIGFEDVEHLWSFKNFVSFCFRFILAFGVVFELPVIVVILGYVRVITSAWLRKIRPYAYVGGFVMGAFLTPMDPLSQLLLALPLIVSYEMSAMIVAIFDRREKEEV